MASASLYFPANPPQLTLTGSLRDSNREEGKKEVFSDASAALLLS